LRCELPLEPEDLYDITSNDIQSEDDGKREAAIDALKIANGWRLDLTDNGEKALSRSLTIAGRLYFTTFTPAPVQEVCSFTPGTGRLYVMDLLTGGAVIDFDSDGDVERWAEIGKLPADTPSTHFSEDGIIRMLFPPDDRGDGSIGNPFDTGARLPGPYGSYWNRGEY
jgi:type IV pilus assembly protein PilY1